MSSLTNKLISGTLILAGITGCSRYVNQPHLEINHQNNYREVVFKDELQGWEDLENLSRNSIDQEEAWVYLPNEKKWVETGIQEGKIKNEIYVKYDPLVFLQLMLKHKDLVSYHLHPKIRIDNTPNGLVHCAIPSAGDIACMISFSNILPHSKGYHFTSKVSSSYGVMEYYLTEKGKKKYASNSYSDYFRLRKQFENQESKFNCTNTANLIKNLGDIYPIEKCYYIAEELSDEDIQLNFTPYLSLESKEQFAETNQNKNLISPYEEYSQRIPDRQIYLRNHENFWTWKKFGFGLLFGLIGITALKRLKDN